MDDTDPTGNVSWWIQGRWNSFPIPGSPPFPGGLCKGCPELSFPGRKPLYLRRCHSNETQMSRALANEHHLGPLSRRCGSVFEASSEKVIPCLFSFFLCGKFSFLLLRRHALRTVTGRENRLAELSLLSHFCWSFDMLLDGHWKGASVNPCYSAIVFTFIHNLRLYV